MSKIPTEIYQKEIGICKKLANENGNKCNWGECEKCGVIPLLYKLHEGILLEDKGVIRDVKNITLSPAMPDQKTSSSFCKHQHSQ
jgi:hypothetical protein